MSKTKIITFRDLSLTSSGVTDTGAGIKLQEVYRELVVMLDVTGAATGSNDTLDVYIDMSPDSGTTWFNVGHFTRVLGDGGAVAHALAIGFDPADTTPVAQEGVDVAAGNVAQIGFCDYIRYRGWVTDTGADGEFTYSVSGFLK